MHKHLAFYGNKFHVMHYLLLILSWFIFYASHTVLASSKLKSFLKVKWGKAYKWYRLLYTMVSVLLFLVIVGQSLLIPAEIILSRGDLSSYFGYMLAAFGTIILMKSSKGYSMVRFLGLVPVKEEKEQLVTSGLYGKVRHPLYAGLILVFAGYFLFSGSITAAIHLACLLIYLPVGIYFEEQNLVEQFGESYKKYQSEVPAIIPRWK
ncbi:isoprenylcysteine carboxylmethyltransferase family protein [Algoriphagus halophytocola]|uniref:methyltransferase family protein n=1 Tax=Algoriphagus halophytocola TaxID=2991499 RepID=UPI0022DD17AD|nr:isoprenylcysteine carboxylmethyltransferase family protein [Algoriphagus sp. TR-M9]WBL42683.1 isoprenylcysteine carboxylmethyltransferase family protein [Algoriphagus sp. TR-M9]